MYEQFESYAGVPKDQRQTLWININQGRIAFRTLLDYVEDSQVERRSLIAAKQTIQEHSTHFLYTSARGEYATPNSVSHADSQIILARDCFNEITRLNLPLVGAIVKRHPSLQAVGSSVGLTNPDLLGYGQVGLVQSADRYDHRTGVDFGTFAHRRIQGAITDALRTISPLSRDDVVLIQSLNSNLQEFWVKEGRSPSLDELSVLMGLDLDSMKDIVRLSNTSLVSLPREGDEGTEDGRFSTEFHLESNYGVEDRPDVIPDILGLREALNSGILSDRELIAVRGYFFDELTMREISRSLGVSNTRVSQYIEEAKRKLAMILGEKYKRKWIYILELDESLKQEVG